MVSTYFLKTGNLEIWNILACTCISKGNWFPISLNRKLGRWLDFGESRSEVTYKIDQRYQSWRILIFGWLLSPIFPSLNSCILENNWSKLMYHIFNLFSQKKQLSKNKWTPGYHVPQLFCLTDWITKMDSFKVPYFYISTIILIYSQWLFVRGTKKNYLQFFSSLELGKGRLIEGLHLENKQVLYVCTESKCLHFPN